MSFVVISSTNTGTQPIQLAAADLDGDGDLDLVVPNTSDNNLTVLLNNGAGVFTPAAGSPIANGGASGIAIADVNGDGFLDLLATTRAQGAPAGTFIRLGDGAAGFVVAPGSPVQGTGTMQGIAVGDFNEDGTPDFVAIDTNNGFAHVGLGAGTGGFAAGPGSGFVTSAGINSVAVGDINGDGNLDFVVAGALNLDLFLGNGAGGFAAGTVLSALSNSPRAVKLADLDGDGDLDAVVATRDADVVTVLLLDGAGGVASTTTFAAGATPAGLAIVDFNRDGNLDLVVSDNGADAVSFLVGNGAGGFGAPTSLATGDGPQAIVSGDFNGDGRVDLAVVHQGPFPGNGTVAVLAFTGLEITADAPAASLEGNSGATTRTFTVTRYGAITGAATVDWAVTGSSGAPADAADFVGAALPSGTVSFGVGDRTQTITVQVAGDLTVEVSEGFTVTLSNASGGLDITAATASAAIVADDAPPAAPTSGTPGNDFVILDAGATNYSALEGNDEVYALDGADTVNGNQGDDLVNGGFGNDVVRGGKGNDQVLGEYGDDRLFGDLGNDRVNGGPGSDTCEGGDGDDQVRGGQGDDWVLGGAGNDFVSGDRGNDTLSGGSGADDFHIFAGAGADRVTDFNAGEGDQVWVAAGTTYSLSQSGADTLVTLSDGTSLTLLGVATASLPTGWIFAA